MDVNLTGGSAAEVREGEMGVRKGPWTVDEDTLLFNYVTAKGEGRWNSVARFAGLKRTGKSCRLRWLNYLRPDVRRGNITLQEQIMILDLHSRWGNRWSKIAQHLPGRTDNEIKNYWRTRVIKQAKQLNCDVNSKQFRDAMRYVWIPRLLERIRAHPTQSITPANLSDSSTEIHVPSNSEHSGSLEFPGREVSDRVSDFSPMDLSFNGQVWGQGNGFGGGGDSLESLWNDENMWFFQQQDL